MTQQSQFSSNNLKWTTKQSIFSLEIFFKKQKIHSITRFFVLTTLQVSFKVLDDKLIFLYQDRVNKKALQRLQSRIVERTYISFILNERYSNLLALMLSSSILTITRMNFIHRLNSLRPLWVPFLPPQDIVDVSIKNEPCRQRVRKANHHAERIARVTLKLMKVHRQLVFNGRIIEVERRKKFILAVVDKLSIRISFWQLSSCPWLNLNWREAGLKLNSIKNVILFIRYSFIFCSSHADFLTVRQTFVKREEINCKKNDVNQISSFLHPLINFSFYLLPISAISFLLFDDEKAIENERQKSSGSFEISLL